MSENSYLRDFSAQVSQIFSLLIRPLYRYELTSYLCDFAQVSQIGSYLTVLRLITTVWPEMTENT